MLTWRIALRYLFSKKSHGAVNIISMISVAGVAVATAAIVIVMSVFNGFNDLVASHLSDIDPEIKVAPSQGKTFDQADSLARALENLPIVAHAAPVVEERALTICGDQQMPVIFKGIPDDYEKIAHLDGIVIDGSRQTNAYGYPGLLLSVGVAMYTGARPGSLINIYVPRRVGRINPANPSAAFRGTEFMATGVFQVDQAEYDNQYVYMPIDQARDLLEYETEGTAIEVALVPGTSADKAAMQIAQALQQQGIQARVLTREQQEESSFRMIMIEKWVTFLMLAFILVIASFNIISTLSLLVIEKRDNMHTLRAMGATRGMIRGIFIRQGWLISMAGGLIGIALGAALTLAQQYGHFIKLAADPSQLTIPYYPVRLQALDLLVAIAVVAVVAFLASQITRMLTNIEDQKQ